MALTDINANASSRGTFRQGEIVNLFLKVIDIGGTPIDPYSITCTVSGPAEDQSAGEEVSTGIPYKGDTGFYIYTWLIEADASVGTYTAEWVYIVDSVETTEVQTVVITDSTPNATFFYTERWVAFRAALEHHINCAQSIPVYYEQAKPSYDLKTYQFSFGEWNNTAGARVYRNGELVSSGINIDYFNGKVTFSTALMSQETINVDYNFKWFSDDELNRFILNSIQSMNTYPPHSGYTVENIPDRFTPAVLYGAAKDALRQLMLCINFQQPAQVFGGPDQAAKAFANFETIKQNYEKDAEKLLEQKKLGPYPRSRMVVTPEFTLPGGRSRWFRYLFK
jgi:hypothetical protein